MKYSCWGDGEGEFTFTEGVELPAHDTPGLKLLKVFEADSWEDACRQYHEWQGWDEYKPTLSVHGCDGFAKVRDTLKATRPRAVPRERFWAALARTLKRLAE